MASPVLTEGFYTAAFLVSEAPGFLSRDTGLIDNAGTVAISQPGGLVLSKNATGTATVTPGANTGNGTLASVTQGALIVSGTYVVTATSATAFTVSDPNGDAMAAAVVGTAYSDAEIGFTLTAGGTAFVAGDKFSVVIPPGDGNFAPYTGAHPAVAVLFTQTENIPAAGNKKAAVIARNAEVNASELQWDPIVTNSGSVVALKATAIGQLRTAAIIAR